MEINKKLLLKNYLSNIQVNLIVAEYIRCPPDWRDIDYIPGYNKFYMIYDGEGMIKIGESIFYPKPGQLVMMPAGMVQSYSVTGSSTFLKHWCHFTATIGDTNLFDILKLPYVIDVSDLDRLKSLFTTLVDNYTSYQLTAQLKIKSALLDIISYFIDNTVVEKIQLADSSSVEKLNCITDYINDHLAENITVEQLARIVHFHPNYFIKFFKSHMGASPIHYINQMRLEKAKSLLASSFVTVTEAAASTGFNNVYYFSKAFKNYTGFSPSEFRSISSYTVKK